MKKFNEKVKDFIKVIKELRKTDRGKGILFFGFYLFLFILVFILIKVGPRNIVSPTDYEKSKSATFSYSSLNNKNYHFTYNINLDNNNYSYVGDKNGDKELFTFNDKKYYRDTNEYFINDNTWVNCENPYKFKDFLEVSKIIEILNSTYYESTTSYDTGKSVFNLLISSNTLNKIVLSKDTDIDEVPNEISVFLDENGIIEKITYNLNSYCTSNNLCDKTLNIELNYSKHGEVHEIEK